MSFFSFGKKDDAPSGRDDYSDSSRGSRQTVRTERRTRRSDRPEADAMMLDPTLPEKQRARRRLVGALALVAAAVIVLPMVLDSHPKPVTDDISIDIPARPAAPLPKTTHSDAAAGQSTDAAPDSDTQAGVAPDSPATGTDNATTAAAPVTKPATKPAETKPQATAAAPAVQKPATPPAPPAAQAKPPADAPATAPAATAAAAQKNTPASPAGSRFVIQIGTFDEDAVAQNWVSKLKAAGVPAYVERRKEADGTTRALLRAGPFADRAAASAALVKVRQAGLGGGNNASAN